VVATSEAQLSVRLCGSADLGQARVSPVGDTRRKDCDAGGADDLPAPEGVFDRLPVEAKERRLVRLVTKLDKGSSFTDPRGI